MVEHTSTGLQQQMRPPADPLQLLLLRKALAHHVDGGLDKPRRNRLESAAERASMFIIN